MKNIYLSFFFVGIEEILMEITYVVVCQVIALVGS